MAVSLEQFIAQLKNSGLISAGDLENLIPPKGQPADVNDLARQLVDGKLLTKFQAQKVYQGRGGGLQLGNYTILDKIRNSRLGQLYKGRDRRSGRLVTITIPPPSVADDRSNSDLLTQRVAATAKLQHPNLIVPRDFRELGNRRFAVADFVEGSSLAAMVDAKGPLSVRQSVEYSLQAANGLEFAHARNLAHGDVCPANLVVDRSGTVKLLGLGLLPAAVQEEPTPAISGNDLGYLDYVAPEVRSGDKLLDPRADIYGLGCTLYCMLAGVSPFAKDTGVNPLLAHRTGIPRPLLEIQPDVPQELSDLVARMLAKDPAARPPTAAEVAAALLPIANGDAPAIKRAVLIPLAEPALGDLFEEIAHAAPPIGARPPRTPARRTQASVIRRYWLHAAIASAATLAGIILYIGLFKVRTADGTIALRVSQPNAEVLVDGKTIAVHWGDDGKSTEFTAPPGKHRIEVKKQGFAVSETDLALEDGGHEILNVALGIAARPGTPVDSPASGTASAVPVRKAIATLNDPAFQQWVKGVAAHPAEEQIKMVVAKLKELNPGYNGTVVNDSNSGPPIIQNGVVDSFGFYTDHISDISPVRALPGLRKLLVWSDGGGWGNVESKLSDLSPLEGLQLKRFSCNWTKVSDLSPLEGMPLEHLSFQGTSVTDLSPLIGMKLRTISFENTKVASLVALKGMPLEILICDSTLVSDLTPVEDMPLVRLGCSETQVSDLSPLRGKRLADLFFTPARINKGIDDVRQMATLRTMGESFWKKMPTPEFWKKYNAGEFGKPDTIAKINANSAPAGGATARASDMPLPAPFAHFHFQGNDKNEGTGEAKWDLQNTVFKDGGLYADGLYDVRNGGPTQGYHAVCSTPSLDPSASRSSFDSRATISAETTGTYLPAEWGGAGSL